MEAKDTVIKKADLGELLVKATGSPVWKEYIPTEKDMLMLFLQAIATFPIAKKQGMEKVVEWVKKQSYTGCDNFGYYTVSLSALQAFLKDNGLDQLKED